MTSGRFFKKCFSCVALRSAAPRTHHGQLTRKPTRGAARSGQPQSNTRGGGSQKNDLRSTGLSSGGGNRTQGELPCRVLPPTTRRLLTPPPQSDRRATRRRRLPAPLYPFPNPTYTDGSPKREPEPAAPPRAAAEHTDHDSADAPGHCSRHSGADGQPQPAGDWAYLANVGALARTKALFLYVLWQVPPPIYKRKRTPQAPRTCVVTRRHPTSGFPPFPPARCVPDRARNCARPEGAWSPTGPVFWPRAL